MLFSQKVFTISLCRTSCGTAVSTELIYSDCNRRYPLTYHYPITEEQLVKLAGKRGEEAAEGGDQAAHDRRQPRRFPPAHRHGHRRDQERHRDGKGAEPA